MHCLWREIIKTFILFVSGIYDESPISSFCCLSIIMEDFIRWGAAGAGQESVFTERSSSWQLSRGSHRGSSRCGHSQGSVTSHAVSDALSSELPRVWQWKCFLLYLHLDCWAVGRCCHVWSVAAVSGSLLLHLVLQEVCHRHDPVHVPGNYN